MSKLLKNDNIADQKNVFMILISSKNYLISAIIISEMLRKYNSKYSLVCAITEDIAGLKTLSLLKKYRILYEVIPKKEYSEDFKKAYPNSSVLNTASKYSLLTNYSFIEKYNKICYMDSDIFIKHNIDNLLDNFEAGSIVCNSFEIKLPDGKKIKKEDLLSGLFIFKPTLKLINTVTTIVEKFLDRTDGSVIEYLYAINSGNNSCKIPFNKFLMDICLINSDIDNDANLYHFWGEKPWLISLEKREELFPKNKYQILYEDYFPILDRIRKEENV